MDPGFNPRAAGMIEVRWVRSYSLDAYYTNTIDALPWLFQDFDSEVKILDHTIDSELIYLTNFIVFDWKPLLQPKSLGSKFNTAAHHSATNLS
eukprot:SAG11_NODE_7891_length_1084_cov_1.207107_1_plen_93_part_00